MTINPLNGGRTCPVPQTENCTIPITNISNAEITPRDITTTLNSTDKFMIFTTGATSFSVSSGGVNCDILMIGGGGAGGYTGGGGAGACIVAIGHTLPGGDYNVTVGDGGSVGNNGVDSSISIGGTTLYLAKGGGRGAYSINNGNTGGCGGGAGSGGSTRSGGNVVNTNIVNGVSTGPTIQPTYTVFGTRGGNQQDITKTLSAESCAGGGGIGAAGGNHANGDSAGGPGGAGLNEATINGIPYNFKSYFANNTTFGYNDNGYIGGGGAGMAYSSSVQADGGNGGGGKGAAYVHINKIIATPGAANTGSGGGCGGSGGGGSGIVIIRYRS
jgi:hypothetical protein